MLVRTSLDAMLPSMDYGSQGEYICKEFCLYMDGSGRSTDSEESHTTLNNERQISVDPMSLKQSARNSAECESFSFVPLTPTTKDTRLHQPVPLPPVKSKFVSASLPSSATSSPRSGSILMNIKKWRNQKFSVSSLARQQSTTVSPFASQVSILRRSKSCGEGRLSMPSDEFDMWTRNLNNSRHESRPSEDLYEYESYDYYEDDRKITKKQSNFREEDFKCGACMFLPGFAKGKPVRQRKEQEAIISRTVSLEKFECGSWASSARISNAEQNGGSVSSYFDLPLELIRDNVNDAHSPVATAFIFEKDRKGVLKKCTSREGTAGKPVESSRHVRFSISNSKSQPASPSCISPRLLKARDDFNAYLQAQEI
ncbi:root hair specific protein [Thalictrum thalictroides]|uniref:Root hair specific protein n=1 Tax=Thalictrum thalictroides TaxID=46969 RepID=A0A7J6WAE8_THATH|nr:root hair specific protein [Thalictrum thalictroides]